MKESEANLGTKLRCLIISHHMRTSLRTTLSKTDRQEPEGSDWSKVGEALYTDLIKAMGSVLNKKPGKA